MPIGRSAAAGVPAAGGADPGEVERDCHEPGELEEGHVQWAQGQAGQVQNQGDREQYGGDDGSDDVLLETVVPQGFRCRSRPGVGSATQ